MRHPISISILTSIFLVTTAAFAEAQTPPSGNYQLERVGAGTLPVLVEEEGDCREELVSATLVIGADNSWSVVGNERETCGATVQTEEETEDGDFTMLGAEIHFGDVDDDTDDADEGEIEWEDLGVGQVDGEALVVRLEDGVTELVFRR